MEHSGLQPNHSPLPADSALLSGNGGVLSESDVLAVGLPSCPAWCGRGDLARYCVDSWDLEGVHVIHGAYHASDTGPGFGTLRTGGGTARVYVSRNDVPDRQGPVEVNLDEDSDLLAYNRMSPEVARQVAVELAAAAEFADRLNAAGITRA